MNGSVYKLIGANVTILANTHNPSIATRDWLLNKGVFEEPVVESINTPVFSMSKTKRYQLVVDDRRLVISATQQPSADDYRIMNGIAERYVRNLPETPYTAVGHNFSWLAEAKDAEELAKLTRQLFVGPKLHLEADLVGIDYQIGAILKYSHHGFVVTLKAEPSLQPVGLQTSVNYHCNTASFDDLLEKLQYGEKALSNGQDVLKSITGEAIVCPK